MKVELAITLDRDAESSLQEQLAGQFRRAILQKRLVRSSPV